MAKKFNKIAIANRGEVALRIIRACNELDIRTLLLHSEADAESFAARAADETISIGPAESSKSYLNIDANIHAAKSMGADAIHPGFGFLSENSHFAEACEQHKMIFIGPTPDSIRLFGDKVSAKNLVSSVGAPTIPGYQGDNQNIEFLISQCEKIGFPLMVKASAGGGGRGLKIIHNMGEARAAITSAQREGQSAFGNSHVFLEKYLGKAKHIEVQIFGDESGRIFCLGERECSVQRRHQKVIEEAPSALIPYELKLKLHQEATKIAQQANYRGAGTIEFLVEGDDFYFLEMNTRLQVEHPVTEFVYGIDLVKAQIQVAQGFSLLWDQAELTPRGHAIECRLYAEDAFAGGLPSTGRLHLCHWPHAPGRRFDVGFESGDEVNPFYDSMLAKIIVHDETRPRAIQKMQQTLKECILFGVKTNLPYLLEILNHEDFVSGKMTTRFIETYFPSGVSNSFSEEDLQNVARQLDSQVSSSVRGGAPFTSEVNSPESVDFPDSSTTTSALWSQRTWGDIT